ncbi:MAG: outer membrane protein assembly factor BamD [Saprospiraceae bacterium]
MFDFSRFSFVKITVLVVMLISAASCKSEFETIRTSNDPEAMYKKAVEYFENKEYSKTQTLFESIVSSFRGKKEFEQLNYMFAYTYYHQHDYASAASAFKNFANTFVYSPYKEEMEYMNAYSLYLLSPNFRLDQEPSVKANDALQSFVNTYPNSERAKECNKLMQDLRRKLEIKALSTGEQYYNMGQYQAAITTMENVLKEFPDSKDAEHLRYLIAKGSFEYAERSVFEKKEERYNDCIKYSQLFINKYPKSKDRAEVHDFIQISKSKLNQIKNVGHQKQSSGD